MNVVYGIANTRRNTRRTRLFAIADGLVVPDRFSAQLKPGEWGAVYDTQLDFEVRDGRPVCVAITCRQAEDGPPIRQYHGLRDLKLAKAEQAASVMVALKASPAGGYEPVGDIGTATQVVRAVRRQGGRERWQLTDDHLKEVAAVYKRALDLGANPTEAVGVEWRKPRSTASRWVKACRERDLLPPAIPGKAG